MSRNKFKVLNVSKNKDKKYKIRRIIFLSILYLGLFLTIGKQIMFKVQQLEVKQQSVYNLQQNLNEQAKVKDELKQDIIKYEQDESYLAKLARHKFNVSKEYEIIFILPESE